MDIRIVSHREPEILNLEAFTELAAFALEREGAPDVVEVSIAIVDSEEIAQLNQSYRGKDGPTDVLSFPCDEPTMAVGPDESITLGDIVIAPEVAEAQALELGHTVEHELNLLLVHGVLHLMGYDHIKDADAQVMQARETSILEAWRIQA